MGQVPLDGRGQGQGGDRWAPCSTTASSRLPVSVSTCLPTSKPPPSPRCPRPTEDREAGDSGERGEVLGHRLARPSELTPDHLPFLGSQESS